MRPLAALERALVRAAHGRGGVVLIDAPPGAGRSMLLNVAAAAAEAACITVLRATGDAVSRDFTFGIVFQLLLSLRAEGTDEERGRLLAGPGAPAASLLDQIPDREATTEEAQHALIHAVAWIVRNHIAASGRAVAVIVDDAHAAEIACCHTERGRPEQAETILERSAHNGRGDPLSRGLYLYLRALLRLVEHRPQKALADALRAGELIEKRFPNASPGMVPWRSTAGEAHLALGQRDAARALARDELVRSRALGVTRTEIRDLRILGLSAAGKGLPHLVEAVRVGDPSPERLEHARALVDFGAELRRRNRRKDAREPLRRGLDLAHKGGAGRLLALARSELTAAGARPRRPDSTGLDSLTPSQLRVAELAGRGLTTRQMAEALFVTPKTVEYHLRHISQKLDVRSRDALRELLASAHAAGETA